MSPVRTLPSGRVGAYHIPVLLAEIETLLASASTVLDCTLGGGGHTAALLERGMHVTGVDRDPRALAAVRPLPLSYSGTTLGTLRGTL